MRIPAHPPMVQFASTRRSVIASPSNPNVNAADQTRFAGCVRSTDERQDLFLNPFNDVYNKFLDDITASPLEIKQANREQIAQVPYDGSFAKGYSHRRQTGTLSVNNNQFQVKTNAYYADKKVGFLSYVADEENVVPKQIKITLPTGEQFKYTFTYPDHKYLLRYKTPEQVVAASYNGVEVTYQSRGQHPFSTTISLQKELSKKEIALLQGILQSMNKECKGQ